jgi:glycosyltransferase involved in cell wall biosynthesis
MLSVITPAFNAARFLPENLASVAALAAEHEHIVVDGASTDGSADLLSRVEDPRVRWVSEPDRGQTHAVNKGLAMARGELIGWLNADDTYVPDVLDDALRELARRPDVDAVHGSMEIVDDRGELLRVQRSTKFRWHRYLFVGGHLATPTIIFRRRLLERAPSLDERFVDAADYDFYLRLLRGAKLLRIEEPSVRFRFYGQSKTGGQVDVQLREAMAIRLARARTPGGRAVMRAIARIRRIRDRAAPPWPELDEVERGARDRS